MDLTKLNSIKDVKPDDILKASEDGSVLILKDGTRVSDELIRQAHTQVKMAAAATDEASRAGKELLNDPDFVAKVSAIAEAAARKVWNEESGKARK